MPCSADSSTVTMPPSPTVCSALAITAPTVVVVVGRDRRHPRVVLLGLHRVGGRLQVLDQLATATSMPRLTRTGLAPAAMAFMPDLTTAWAMTVAVVVPSPTMSLVLIAASLTSWAPMFSNWFFRWISRAIVTPSLVTTGDPVIFSRMTLRPFGPSVDFTASASWSTPASSRERASSLKRSSLAIVRSSWRSCVFRDVGERTGRGSRGRGPGRRRDRPAPPAPGVQRVGPGVQGDLARLGQHHQLGEVVVGADDVADDVALGGDDVERRDVQLAAVADHVVRAGPAGHRQAVVLRALLGDEVEHHVRAALPVRSWTAATWLPSATTVWCRAELLGELERVRVAVHHDEVGGGQRGDALDADVPEPARADDHGGGARVQQRQRLADRVVGGDARRRPAPRRPWAGCSGRA